MSNPSTNSFEAHWWCSLHLCDLIFNIPECSFVAEVQHKYDKCKCSIGNVSKSGCNSKCSGKIGASFNTRGNELPCVQASIYQTHLPKLANHEFKYGSWNFEAPFKFQPQLQFPAISYLRQTTKLTIRGFKVYHTSLITHFPEYAFNRIPDQHMKKLFLSFVIYSFCPQKPLLVYKL